MENRDRGGCKVQRMFNIMKKSNWKEELETGNKSNKMFSEELM